MVNTFEWKTVWSKWYCSPICLDRVTFNWYLLLLASSQTQKLQTPYYTKTNLQKCFPRVIFFCLLECLDGSLFIFHETGFTMDHLCAGQMECATVGLFRQLTNTPSKNNENQLSGIWILYLYRRYFNLDFQLWKNSTDSWLTFLNNFIFEM